MGMQEGTIVEWYKAVGDVVEKDEALLSVEAEKTTDDILAPISGTLTEVRAAVGETVQALSILAVIDARMETDPSTPDSSQPSISPVARADEAVADEIRSAGISTADVLNREPEVIPLTGMRGAIARRMHTSMQTMAQLTMMRDADVTLLVERQAASDFTVTDFLIAATIRALVRHPRLNATLADDRIVLASTVNLGIAVAIEDGLIVPVLRDAEAKTMRQRFEERNDLATRARAGSLGLDEVSGGTFTITNLGNYGIGAFTPIINPPEVAILGIGRIRDQLARDGEQSTWRSVLTLSLTIDHRAVDGAPGAQFLQTLADLMNEPNRLVD
jgi:pyruvate dehydrogenase E2 component (dihydrolipoamide acetyltransferase)